MKDSNSILVLGSGGFLGSHFMQHHNDLGAVQRRSIEIYGLKKKISKNAIERDLEIVRKFPIVVNCIALRDIEVCERDQERADYLNNFLPFELARVCEREGNKLIHFSTDAVYGDLTGKRHEESVCKPKSVYARSKLAGENSVLLANNRALVVRTNFFGYSKSSKTLVNFVLDSINRKKHMSGFTDVLFNALYVEKLVRVVLELIDVDATGLINVGNEDSISKFEFIQLLLSELNLPLNVVYPTEAACDKRFRIYRNLDLRMDVTRLKSITSEQLSIRKDIVTLGNKIKEEGLLKND